MEFTKPLEDQTVEEEATATLECEVSRDNAEVVWLRDGQEIRKTKKYEMVIDGCKRALVIRDCLLDDSRTYTCAAKDFKTSCFLSVERECLLLQSECESVVPLTSHALWLPTAPHVEFTKPLHDVEVREKESARFECEVSREDIKVRTSSSSSGLFMTHVWTFSFTSVLPQVRWFRDGSEIRKGKKYEIIAQGRQHILIVHKSVFDDEAEYECDAKTSKSSGMLTVIGENCSGHI